MAMAVPADRERIRDQRVFRPGFDDHLLINWVGVRFHGRREDRAAQHAGKARRHGLGHLLRRTDAAGEQDTASGQPGGRELSEQILIGKAAEMMPPGPRGLQHDEISPVVECFLRILDTAQLNAAGAVSRRQA